MYESKGRAKSAGLRKRLEYLYDHMRLEEAILLGNKLDDMQCLLIQKNKTKPPADHSYQAISMGYSCLVADAVAR